jgi:hypothetical protein
MPLEAPVIMTTGFSAMFMDDFTHSIDLFDEGLSFFAQKFVAAEKKVLFTRVSFVSSQPKSVDHGFIGDLRSTTQLLRGQARR